MSGSRLGVNVVLVHPETKAPVVFVSGETPPDWAMPLLGDHVWASDNVDDADDDDEAAEQVPPPKAGPGSGRDAWAAYAAHHDVDVDPDDKRDDIVTALDDLGIPT